MAQVMVRDIGPYIGACPSLFSVTVIPVPTIEDTVAILFPRWLGFGSFRAFLIRIKGDDLDAFASILRQIVQRRAQYFLRSGRVICWMIIAVSSTCILREDFGSQTNHSAILLVRSSDELHV